MVPEIFDVNILNKKYEKIGECISFQQGYMALKHIRRWSSFLAIIFILFALYKEMNAGFIMLGYYSLVCLFPYFDYKRWEVWISRATITYSNAYGDEKITPDDVAEVVKYRKHIWVLYKNGTDRRLPLHGLPKGLRKKVEDIVCSYS